MTTLNANGRAERKSLANQIDRLDRILDGLADGLNQAVVASVKEAVTEVVSKAVVAAVKEVLTNAELQKRLRPEPVSRPSAWLGGRMLCHGVVRLVRVAGTVQWP